MTVDSQGTPAQPLVPPPHHRHRHTTDPTAETTFEDDPTVVGETSPEHDGHSRTVHTGEIYRAK